MSTYKEREREIVTERDMDGHIQTVTERDRDGHLHADSGKHRRTDIE